MCSNAKAKPFFGASMISGVIIYPRLKIIWPKDFGIERIREQLQKKIKTRFQAAIMLYSNHVLIIASLFE